MKKVLSKAFSVLLVAAILLFGGFGAFAADYDHTLSGYGNIGGSDDRVTDWGAIVTPIYVYVWGYYRTERATGDVYLCAAIDGNYYDSDAPNSNSLMIYGYGTWGEVYFHTTDYTTPTQYYQRDYGSTSGSNSQTSWSLIVNSSYSYAHGEVLSGYTGTVYCYTDVDFTTANTSATDANTLSTNGNGYSAGVTFSNITAYPIPITDSCDEKQSGYGSKSGSTSQLSWGLEVNSLHARSSGSVSSGYTGSVYCGVEVGGNWTDSDVTDSNTLDIGGNGSYAEIWIR